MVVAARSDGRRSWRIPAVREKPDVSPKRALRKYRSSDSLGRTQEHDSPMSRRDLSQPSFGDAIIATRIEGRFSDRVVGTARTKL